MAEVKGLNLSWVQEGFAIGGSFPSSSVAKLAELGVRHILDVRDRSSNDIATMLANGVDFLHLPIPDKDVATRAAIDRGIQWTLPRLERREKVLVHCEHGMGRSVLLGLCLLVRLGAQPRDALIQLKQARPAASPSPRQLEVFIEWATRAEKRPPSWDDLARIAYSSALSISSEAVARA